MIIPETEVIYRMWQRGKGYYNAHEHRIVLSWPAFQELESIARQSRDIQKARYLGYLLSWAMFNTKSPEPEEIHTDPDAAAIIWKAHDEMLSTELARLKEEQTKGKKSGSKSR